MRKSDTDTVRQILEIRHMQAVQDLAAIKQKIRASVDAAQALEASKQAAWEAIADDDAEAHARNQKFIAFIDAKQRAEAEKQASLQGKLRIAEANMKSVLHASAALSVTK